ncbi:MAG: hypothetical protein WCV90_05160 [Candidatus Woesearchaeota archaeon]|jgi:hypothetical protein
MVMEWSPVLGTVEEFIDYALFFVGVAVAYYVVRLIMTARNKEDRAAREAEWAERGEATRKWAGERWTAYKTQAEKKEDDRKNKEEKERVKSLASPVIDHIHKAIDLCQVGEHQLSKKERTPAIRTAHEVIDRLKKAKYGLRQMRHRFPKAHDKIDPIITEIEVQLKKVDHEWIDNIPNKVEADWDTKIAPIKTLISGTILPGCGKIFTDITKLYV